MSKEKQIEEMAKYLHYTCEGECFRDKDGFIDCDACKACYLYDAGYRKQSEGEWGFDGMSWTCSECGEYAPVDKYGQTRHTDFCPECGAKMKGGAE